MNNPNFGFPYWQWEENDRTPFNKKYYGVPSNIYSLANKNVVGDLFDSRKWSTVCDLSYQDSSLDCNVYWRPCNPANDLQEKRPLQRGRGSSYLPNRFEVKIAIAAPSYDAASDSGQYNIYSPRTSFRSRLEGWNNICSASQCVGTREPKGNPTFSDRMHNNVHDWVGGQMDVVPAAVNDPIFNLHHCNVDRVFESWINRFDPAHLPAYVPVSGGHPGHNRDDFMVPFFPLISASKQYANAEERGYTYDNVVAASIMDESIADCKSPDTCPICDGTCIGCTILNGQLCPAPVRRAVNGGHLPIPQVGTVSTPTSLDLASMIQPIDIAFGLTVILLLVAIVVIIILSVVLIKKRKNEDVSVQQMQR